MREDIAAIEACNNTLELQARNNAKLLTTLQGLVNDLALDQETTWLLENPSFTGDRCGRRAAAAAVRRRRLRRGCADRATAGATLLLLAAGAADSRCRCCRPAAARLRPC
jgi:hypothetical protein